MATRKMIRIDQDKCVGCAQCVNHCPGGALAMVDGKAKLVRDDFCDGLGVCLGECPVGAISFVDVEVKESAALAAPVTPAAQAAPIARHTPPAGGCPGTQNKQLGGHTPPAGGCPGKMNMQLRPGVGSAAAPVAGAGIAAPSELGAWPIQLHLIRPEAPQFVGRNILIAASCSAFACGGFHPRFLAGKGLIIACPKLDRQEGYREKLVALFAGSAPASVTVVRMEVPCCSGLTRLVVEARDESGSGLPVTEVTVGLSGEVIAEKVL